MRVKVKTIPVIALVLLTLNKIRAQKTLKRGKLHIIPFITQNGVTVLFRILGEEQNRFVSLLPIIMKKSGMHKVICEYRIHTTLKIKEQVLIKTSLSP